MIIEMVFPSVFALFISAFAIHLVFQERQYYKKGWEDQASRMEQILKGHLSEVQYLKTEKVSLERDLENWKKRTAKLEAQLAFERKDVTDRVRSLLEHLEGNETNSEEAERCNPYETWTRSSTRSVRNRETT
jgi:hypothetical protein